LLPTMAHAAWNQTVQWCAPRRYVASPAAVDNPAPLCNRSVSPYKSRGGVQTTGATSPCEPGKPFNTPCQPNSRNKPCGSEPPRYGMVVLSVSSTAVAECRRGAAPAAGIFIAIKIIATFIVEDHNCTFNLWKFKAPNCVRTYVLATKNTIFNNCTIARTTFRLFCVQPCTQNIERIGHAQCSEPYCKLGHRPTRRNSRGNLPLSYRRIFYLVSPAPGR
jgi:hypothetical protein